MQAFSLLENHIFTDLDCLKEKTNLTYSYSVNSVHERKLITVINDNNILIDSRQTL